MNPTNIAPEKIIEKLICEPFHKLIPTSDNMTIEDKQIFTLIGGVPEDFEQKHPDKYIQLNNRKDFKIVDDLSKKITVKICLRTKMWLAYISLSKDAVIFIYLYYIQYMAKKNNVFEVDFRWFCEKLFPEGFVKQESLNELITTMVNYTDDIYTKSIQWTKDDLADYESAKAEITAFRPNFGQNKSTNKEEPKKEKFSAMDLMKKGNFLDKFK